MPTITPPPARRDAPFPELRSRPEKILNVPHPGKEPVLVGSG